MLAVTDKFLSAASDKNILFHIECEKFIMQFVSIQVHRYDLIAEPKIYAFYGKRFSLFVLSIEVLFTVTFL